MRLPALAVVVIVAAAPIRAFAEPPTEDTARLTLSAVLGAFGAHDDAVVRGAFSPKVMLEKLPFTDRACRKAFGGKRTIARGKSQSRLARCLLDATWVPTAATRVVELLPDGSGWSAALGTDPMLQVNLAPGKDGTLQIRSIALVPDAIQQATIDRVDGVPNGVSEGGSLADLGAPPPPPPPPPPAPVVAPTALETLRVAGDKNILPDAATKKAIVLSGKTRIVAAFKLCVSEAGEVFGVRLLKASGFPAYDKALTTGINTWRYRPYRVDGKATSVCSAVTFIYTTPP